MARSFITRPRLSALPAGSYSIEFDGITQRAETASNFGIVGSQACSYGGWFKLLTLINTNGAGTMALGAMNAFTTGLGPITTINSGPFPNSLFGPYFNGSAPSIYRITTGEWVHIVATFSGGTNGTAKMYINGSLVYTQTITPVCVNGKAAMAGVFFTPFGTYIYSKAKYAASFAYTDELTETEVQNIYANQIYPTDNVKALWRMTEGSGTTIADSSGNGFDLIANTAPIWSNSDLPVIPRTYASTRAYATSRNYIT